MTETSSRGQNFVPGTFFLRDKNVVPKTTIITPLLFLLSWQQSASSNTIHPPTTRPTIAEATPPSPHSNWWIPIFPLDDPATTLSSPTTIVGGGTTAVAVSRTSPHTYRRPTICSCCRTMTTSPYSRTSPPTVAPSSTSSERLRSSRKLASRMASRSSRSSTRTSHDNSSNTYY